MKKKIIIITTILSVIYLLLVIVSNMTLKAIPFPAPKEFLEMGFDQEKSLKFVNFKLPNKNETVLATVILENNKEYILPLKELAKKHSVDSSKFSNSSLLVKNINSIKPIIRDLIKKEKSSLDKVKRYIEKDVILMPFLKTPTKVLHGTNSRMHSRNIKRAAVKRTLPNVARFILNPYNFITGGKFYEKSIDEMKFGFFHANNTNLYTHKNVITLKNGTKMFDPEAELAVVICKNGQNIDSKNAMDYVAGYVLYNDLTDRELQDKERATTYTGYQNSKAISSMGAYFITDIDHKKMAVTIYKNGKEVATASANEIFDFMSLEDQLAEYSKFGGLAEGQVIATGTMAGGSFTELDIPRLKKGDTIRIVGNQGLGELTNTIK